jgi:3-oxoadipate enol-lactonase
MTEILRGTGTITPERAPLYAPAHSQRLWYRQVGNGPAVVLLHGLADSHDLWRHQLDALSTRYRVVAVDLRGHGRTGFDGRPFTLSDLAADVLATLSDLRIQRCVLVGLSMGGGVAQTLAIEHPGVVEALVLVSTSSDFPSATRRRFVDRAAVAERDGMAAVVDVTVPRWFTPAFAAAHPREVARTRRAVLAMDPRAFAAASRANAVRDLTNRLGTVRCPVLFVGGSDDPAEPERALATYRRVLRNLRAEIVPATSHLVPVEAPDRFNDILLRFLAEVHQSKEGDTG